MKPITTQEVFISMFGNKVFKPTKLDKVSLNLKGFSNQNFQIKPLCTPFICSPIRNQQIIFAKTQFEYLENLADSGLKVDIDLLTGSDYYWPVVTGKVKVGKMQEPIEVEKTF